GHAKGAQLAGATHVDALLLNARNGFAVIFEAKVLSDVSTRVECDALRNQLARNIDVLLESPTNQSDIRFSRRPSHSCLVLVTPQLFKAIPSGRLYGWLMPRYQEKATSNYKRTWII